MDFHGIRISKITLIGFAFTIAYILFIVFLDSGWSVLFAGLGAFIVAPALGVIISAEEAYKYDYEEETKASETKAKWFGGITFCVLFFVFMSMAKNYYDEPKARNNNNKAFRDCMNYYGVGSAKSSDCVYLYNPQ